MAMKIDAKLEEKLIFGLENDMRNLAKYLIFDIKNIKYKVFNI